MIIIFYPRTIWLRIHATESKIKYIYTRSRFGIIYIYMVNKRETEMRWGKSKYTLQGFPERSMWSLISMSLASRNFPILLAMEAPASLDSVMFYHAREREREVENRFLIFFSRVWWTIFFKSPDFPIPFYPIPSSCCIIVIACIPRSSWQKTLFGQTQPLLRRNHNDVS